MEDYEVTIDSAGRTIIKDRSVEPKKEVKDEYLHLIRNPNSSPYQSDDEMRISLADEMYRMIKYVKNSDLDALVFLDKSARPAAWFFEAMWKCIYPEEHHPDIKFVNIGQEKAPNAKNFQENFEQAEANLRENERLIGKLRNHFRIGNTDKTYLDNKEVLILDEYSHTGETLRVARILFEGAFGNRSYDNIHAQPIFSVEPPWISIDKTRSIEALGIADRKPGDFSVITVSPVPHEVNQLKHEFKMLAVETARRLQGT